MEVRNELVVVVAGLLFGGGLWLGWRVNETQYTTRPVKPSIQVVTLDGVSDTTYIYHFGD